MTPRSIALAFCAAALCAPALAVTTVYSFGGVVDTNNTASPFTSFTGQFSFDAATPDTSPADANNGSYPMFGGVYGMQATFNDGTVFVVDAVTRYSLSVHVPLATPIGQPPDVGRFIAGGRLVNQNDRFIELRFLADFQTDALPAPAGGFTLASFDQALFSYHGLPNIAPPPGQPAPPEFGAFGHLTSLACIEGCDRIGDPIPAVPEPETYALMLSGLAATGWLARRRRPAEITPAMR